jgi:hypothetical protein
MKMTSNGKIFNYNVVDLVEIYNFHIKFTSIRVQTKNYKFFKTDWTPPWPTVVAGATVSARVRNAVGLAKKISNHVSDERKM